MEEIIPKYWFDQGQALKIVRYYFSRGKEKIRIATGFFTIRGYNLIRGSSKGKRMYILVGMDDPGEDRLRKALVQEIMRDLRTGLDENRREAVEELVQKMEGGNFRIIDARAKKHHAKLFIVDEDIVLVGSSNVSQRGMLDAIESGTVEENPQKVDFFSKMFETHFNAPDCVDITQELIEALRSWLGMATPWDIYLKTLNALKSLDDLDLVRITYKRPVGYQQDVIARILRQMEAFHGAMLVASTGLGKTVIATDVALRLQKELGLLNVLVIGPKPVENSWRNHLRPAGIALEFFNHNALNREDLEKNQFAKELQILLDNHLDEKWLVIIDESHEFRNRYKEKLIDGEIIRSEHSSYQRLRPAIKRTGCYVLLLTATPYAKDLKNINNQLYLLPHKGPQQTLFDNIKDAYAWKINQIEDLKSLDPVSVLTTPYVAKHYGMDDGKGIYIDFSAGKRYFPKVMLYAIRTPLFFEMEVGSILDHRYLKRGGPKAFKQPIETQAKISWGSSPWSLLEVLEKAIISPEEGGYNVKFTFGLEKRKEIIRPLIDQLSKMTIDDDEKFIALVNILDRFCVKNQKAIIFTERHATAAYLEMGLKKLRPGLKIASTVEMKSKGEYVLKTKETENIFREFAPLSHDLPESQGKYNILIATDAHGVGINLQDAMTVINYDLAWTTVEPDQRAGRILRFWKEPRGVNLCTFIPVIQNESEHKRVSLSILRRWYMLSQRHSHAKTVLDMPTITSKSSSEVNLPEMGGERRIEMIGELNYESLKELGSSKIFEHTAVLEHNKSYAQNLPEDIISARSYEGENPIIFVLLTRKGKYLWILYDCKEKKLIQKRQDIELLELIQCSRYFETAPVNPNVVEKLTQKAVRLWCKENGYSPKEILRVCGLYLIPDSQNPSFDEWLEK